MNHQTVFFLRNFEGEVYTYLMPSVLVLFKSTFMEKEKMQFKSFDTGDSVALAT